MTEWRSAALLAFVLLQACGGSGPPRGTGSDATSPATLQSETHIFEAIAPGVYFATAAGPVNVGSNAMVVVNEDDVLVVDSHITPDAARALINSVKTITDKPLHFLVNSHFHFDHVNGNQAFPEGIQIIGHENTREKLLGDVLREPTYAVISGDAYLTSAVEDLEKKPAAAGDDARASLEAQLSTLRRHIKALGEVEPTPPNTTLLTKLTLHRGSREIQIRHLGRGHTGGDVVVFLPAERIVFTGDLFYDGAPYLGDSFPEDFIQTLENLKQLDFDVAVPGHGPLVRDRNKIDFNQTYLRTYWDQVKGFHQQGLSAEQAIRRLDLSGYEEFATFLFSRPEVRELELRRMYHLLDGGR